MSCWSFALVGYAAVAVAIAQTHNRSLTFLDPLRGAHGLPPHALARLEADLLHIPGDLTTRTRLLGHYLQHANGAARLPHVLWVVNHRPGSKLAGSPLVRIAPATDNLSTRSDYELLKAAWLSALELRQQDPAVLGNAGLFFADEEPVRAGELLRRAWQLDSANKMRRAALIAFYKRVLSVCERKASNCPDLLWMSRAKAELNSLTAQ